MSYFFFILLESAIWAKEGSQGATTLGFRPYKVQTLVGVEIRALTHS